MTQAPDLDGTGTPAAGALVTSVPSSWPPRGGPDGDKEAWVAFAREVVLSSKEAREAMGEQATLIATLEAEMGSVANPD